MLALKLTTASSGRILLLSSYTPPGPIEVSTGNELTSFSVFFDGEVGTTATLNNTYIDSSPNNLTVTASSNLWGQSSFSPFGKQGWCASFDGSNSLVSFGNTPVGVRYPQFSFMHNSTATFTYECWIFRETSVANTLIDNTDNTINTNTGTRIGIYAASVNTTSNKLYMQVVGTTNTLAVDARSSSEIALNTWTHIAVTYDRSIITGTAKIYINGILDGVADRGPGNPNDLGSRSPLYIGLSKVNGSGQFQGAMSDLRISNTVLYNSNFTPPTAPVTASSATTALLTFQHQNSRVVDNSVNNYTPDNMVGNRADQGTGSKFSISPGSPYKFSLYTSSTGGSMCLANATYLTVSSSTALVLGSDDFTIDCWVYTYTAGADLPEYDPPLLSRLDTRANRNFYISYNRRLGFGTSTARTFESSIEVPGDQWTHVAVERSSNTMRLYINGVIAGTTTTNLPVLTQQNNLIIGRGADLSRGAIDGYISDFRITKGVAMFNGAFTPPTSMATATAQTSLLLNFTNGAAIDVTGKNVFSFPATPLGSNQTLIDSSVKKNGNASLRFGDGGYAQVKPGRSTINFGTANFTIEFWVNFRAPWAAGKRLVSYNHAGSATRTNNPLLIQTETNKIGLYATSDGSSWNIANNLTVFSGTPTTSVWHHLAVTRNGNTIRTFANGTLVSSTSTSLSLLTPGADTEMTIGSAECYIDDFRIYKGYAKYTDSFTPE